MVRPRKLRRVALLPGATYFKPQGIPLRLLEEVRLSVDELEALRLKDVEGLEQEESAAEMAISRQTFQRVLEEAHRKVAEVLVMGKALRIEGGDYELSPMRFLCRQCGHSWEQLLSGGVPVACPSCERRARGPFSRGRCWPQGKIANSSLETRQVAGMKIAAISDDGKSMSMHFGRAQLYVVAEVQDGVIVSRDVRSKAGHYTFGDHPHEEHSGVPHGYDASSQHKHSQMAANIADCQVLLAGGMGYGAYDSLKSHGIEPIITDIRDVDQAFRAYLDGTIRNLMDRLH